MEYTKKADKALRELDQQHATRIKKRLAKIVSQGDPRKPPQKMAPLDGAEGIWYCQIGDYRAVCEIWEAKQPVDVLGAGHRKDIYKHMNRWLDSIGG